MNKALQKELRNILTGRVILRDDGWLTAISNHEKIIFHGVTEGWENVNFRPLAQMEWEFAMAGDGEEVYEKCLRAMDSIGKMVDLKEEPESLACVIRFVLTKPIVITVFPKDEDTIRLRVYTGKTMFYKITCERGFRQFQKSLRLHGEVITGDCVSVEAVEEKPAGKKRKKSFFAKKGE